MEQSDSEVYEKYKQLCSTLNMNKAASEEAWNSYVSLNENFTLEGDPIHWLGCALYVACRKSKVPTVARHNLLIDGNLVSLTSLLRHCELSLLSFFKLGRKWADMANLPQEFMKKIDSLENNYAVSMITFQSYQIIFNDLFNKPTKKVEQHKSKKFRNSVCTTSDLFDFCWTLFVCVKGSFPDLTDDLVNSYHLLLSCLGMMFSNAVLSNRKDLLNPNFKGLPSNFNDSNYTPPTDPPCVINTLCEEHNGLHVEAKSIKIYMWNKFITKWLETDKLKGDSKNLSKLLEPNNYTYNTKSINKIYEEYVLSVGDFDERIFLSEEANKDIGTTANSDSPEAQTEVQFRKDSPLTSKHANPQTPLSGRKWLKISSTLSKVLPPLARAKLNVTKLNTILENLEPKPSTKLSSLLTRVQKETVEKINLLISEMSDKFTCAYTQGQQLQAQQGIDNYKTDFILKRLQLAQTLYYKLFEKMLIEELKKNSNWPLEVIYNQTLMHQTLFAGCLEIVMYSYSSQKTFPWLLEVLNIEPFHFYKIIEMIVRAEDQLTRDVIKHLNMIEEEIIDSLAWTTRSPLWLRIKESNLPIPSCEEVSLSSQLMDEDEMKTQKNESVNQVVNKTLNPGSSLSDRFISPREPSLYIQTITNNARNGVLRAAQSLLNTKRTGSGENVAGSETEKPRRTGSLALFFRKFYLLSSVRMQDLCMHLDIRDVELKRKIWTCFEYSIKNHTELMRDRHLDQILMCAVYVICKVAHTNAIPAERTFTEIMKCYRQQPQAASNVYRNVLIEPNNGGEHQSNRGDLIKFYNTVYVKKVQDIAKEFQSASLTQTTIPLSPLMRERSLNVPSPQRRVSKMHSVYVSPLDPKHSLPPDSPSLTYTFEPSQSKGMDLQAINSFIDESSKELKRKTVDIGDSVGPVPVKRPLKQVPRKIELS